MIQHDMMMFDHGMPRADGTLSRSSVPRPTSTSSSRSTSKMSRATRRSWRGHSQAANDKYATDYPATVGPHMTQHRFGAVQGPRRPQSACARTSAERRSAPGWDPTLASADRRLRDVQRQGFPPGLERRADDTGRPRHAYWSVDQAVTRGLQNSQLPFASEIPCPTGARSSSGPPRLAARSAWAHCPPDHSGQHERPSLRKSRRDVGRAPASAQHPHPRRHRIHRTRAGRLRDRARASRHAVQSRQDAPGRVQGKGRRGVHRRPEQRHERARGKEVRRRDRQPDDASRPGCGTPRKYLAGNTKHYIFISTTSVYRDQSQIGIDENSPTVPMPEGLDPYQPDQRNSAVAASRIRRTTARSRRAPSRKCRSSIRGSTRSFARA